MDYPTEQQLISMGETLQRDVCLWPDALARAFATNEHCRPNVPVTKRRHVKKPSPRRYRSRFVGVTTNKGRWCGFLDERSTRPGPRRDTEIEAAWDRARALGRPGLEERPLDQVLPVEEVAKLIALGPSRKRLGGKRIA